MFALVTASLVLIAAGVAGAVVLQLGPWQPGASTPTPVEDPPSAAAGAVLIVTDDPSGSGAGRMAVAGFDPERDDATVLLLPVTTVTDLPGHGTLAIGESLELGGPALAGLAVTNLLGTQLDGVLRLDVDAWAALIAALDPISVDVRRATVLDAGLGPVELVPGPQTLEADALATYLVDRRDPGGELASLARAQAGLQGILTALGREPDPADALVARAEVEAQDREALTATLDRVVTASSRGDLAALTLPVDALGTGEQGAYRPDEQRIAALVDDRFAAVLPTSGPGVGVRVQILDGNGIPSIAEPVAERLLDGGYRVVLSGNADRFTYQRTRIVVYAADARSQAIATDIQQRLGVGEVERSVAPQSVVDVTIVVGGDFTG